MDDAPATPATPRRRRAALAAGVVALLVTGGAVATLTARDDGAAGTGPTAAPTSRPAASAPIGLDVVLARSEAVTDLDLAAQAVRDRHPMCVDACPARFEQVLREERDALPEAPTTLDVRRAVARTLAAMGDAHTAAVPPAPSAQAAVDLVWAGDRYLCASAPCTDREVVAVDGTPVAALRERNRALVPHERAQFADRRLARSLTLREDLRMLGLDPGRTVALTLADGASVDVGLSRVRDPEVPPAVAWQVEPTGTAAVLTLGTCVVDDALRQALTAMFAEVHARGIGAVVVDVRGNGGGDSRVADEIVRHLAVDTFRVFSRAEVREGDAIQTYTGEPEPVDHVAGPLFDGEVVVLTDGGTFSSAVNLAAAFQDQGLARVVGETPDGMPSAYGDLVTTRLPRTGIEVAVSTKKFVQVDAAAQAEPLLPDVEVPGDQALDAAISLLAGGA